MTHLYSFTEKINYPGRVQNIPEDQTLCFLLKDLLKDDEIKGMINSWVLKVIERQKQTPISKKFLRKLEDIWENIDLNPDNINEVFLSELNDTFQNLKPVEHKILVLLSQFRAILFSISTKGPNPINFLSKQSKGSYLKKSKNLTGSLQDLTESIFEGEIIQEKKKIPKETKINLEKQNSIEIMPDNFLETTFYLLENSPESVLHFFENLKEPKNLLKSDFNNDNINNSQQAFLNKILSEIHENTPKSLLLALLEFFYKINYLEKGSWEINISFLSKIFPEVQPDDKFSLNLRNRIISGLLEKKPSSKKRTNLNGKVISKNIEDGYLNILSCLKYEEDAEQKELVQNSYFQLKFKNLETSNDLEKLLFDFHDSLDLLNKYQFEEISAYILKNGNIIDYSDYLEFVQNKNSKFKTPSFLKITKKVNGFISQIINSNNPLEAFLKLKEEHSYHFNFLKHLTPELSFDDLIIFSHEFESFLGSDLVLALKNEKLFVKNNSGKKDEPLNLKYVLNTFSFIFMPALFSKITEDNFSSNDIDFKNAKTWRLLFCMLPDFKNLENPEIYKKLIFLLNKNKKKNSLNHDENSYFKDLLKTLEIEKNSVLLKNLMLKNL